MKYDLEIEDIVKHFNENIFILGTNKYGLCLADWFRKRKIVIKGFINDYVSDVKFADYKIFSSKHYFENSYIINCIIEGRTIDAENNIIKLNPKFHDDYFRLQKKYSTELLAIDYLGAEDEMNSDEIANIDNRLCDMQSRVEFKSILSFRRTRDLSYLKIFKFRPQDQYFEEFIKLARHPVFIDAGGFDGYTSLQFANLFPDYRHIYFFEPSYKYFLNSQINLEALKNITFINKGLWNKEEQLLFDDSLGNASRIASNGHAKINVLALDEFIDGSIDYIKMDIEGAEYKALLGAKRMITLYKPKLAICVYHNSFDYIRIPKLILSFNSKYSVYFRHYTQGICESVMYFV